jgi:F-type H+-transporting ATPase subunit alpha
VLVIFAGVKGHLDDIPVNKVREFESGLISYVEAKAADVFKEIDNGDKMSDALIQKITALITEFKNGFAPRA